MELFLSEYEITGNQMDQVPASEIQDFILSLHEQNKLDVEIIFELYGSPGWYILIVHDMITQYCNEQKLQRVELNKQHGFGEEVFSGILHKLFQTKNTTTLPTPMLLPSSTLDLKYQQVLGIFFQEFHMTGKSEDWISMHDVETLFRQSDIVDKLGGLFANILEDRFHPVFIKHVMEQFCQEFALPMPEFGVMKEGMAGISGLMQIITPASSPILGSHVVTPMQPKKRTREPFQRDPYPLRKRSF